jgi:hypothetical protein
MRINLNRRIDNGLILGLVSIAILILLITAIAQTSLIEVTAEVDKSVITIGDRITYSLKIKRDKNLRIEQPGPAANLGMFEIKDYKIHDPVQENGNIVEQYDYVISVFDTGKFVIPSFPVAFFPSDTSHKYQIIQSEPIDITVESLLSAEDNDIKDIKPPLQIPVEYRRFILIGGGILLLIGIGAFLFYYYRRRKQGVPLFKREVIRPAHEIAFEAIDELLRKSYLEKQEFKQFFTELSDVLRHYLENRFFITAMEETTAELLESMQELELDDEDSAKSKEVLDISDLVKFAKYEPQQQEIDDAIEMTKAFIQSTHLEFEAVESIKKIEENPVSPDGELEQENHK